MTPSEVLAAHPRIPNLLGHKFFRLKVKAFIGISPRKHGMWLCRCDCGRTKIVETAYLRSRNTKSCGCYKQDCHPTLTHGFCKYPEYGIYRGMMARCQNPQNESYKNYGGRGIQVCERWQHFPNWYADLCPRPTGATMERQDNNGHYSCGQCLQCIAHGWPLNVIWIPRPKQLRNTRRNHWLTFQGRTLCLIEWDEVQGFPPGLISKRLHKRWTEERALTTPWKRGGPHYITFKGMTHHLNAWDRVLGFPPSTVANRLHKGWTEERALTTPLRVWET